MAQDHKEAVVWYAKCVDMGSMIGHYNLGMLTYYGHGVPQDYHKAFGLLQKAAESGDADAQFRIAWMYEQGLGIKQNYKQAYGWYEKASAQGHKEANHNMRVLAANGNAGPLEMPDWLKTIILKVNSLLK